MLPIKVKIKKGNKTKLVHPEKINVYLNDGWVRVKK